MELLLPKGLSCFPLADRPDTAAFLDGPVVLAGLTDRQKVLTGDLEHPETMLRLQDEREWGKLAGCVLYREPGGIHQIPAPQTDREKNGTPSTSPIRGRRGCTLQTARLFRRTAPCK